MEHPPYSPILGHKINVARGRCFFGLWSGFVGCMARGKQERVMDLDVSFTPKHAVHQASILF